jgi:myo-inositol-1(or 4)-monophosphatase
MARDPGSPVTAEPAELAALAIDIAQRVGAVALDGRRRGLTRVSTKSTSTDMVTEYDTLTEASIFAALREARPDDTIVGEEGASHVGSSGITWYVDPIDGTTNFLYDLPTWAVSIGAHDADGHGLVGVVHAPALGETFHATRGGGAFLNGSPIRCNNEVDLTRALVATGFNYSPANRVIQARRIPYIIDKIRDVRRFGAASLDMCFVACGRYDAYYEEHLFPWDISAGSIIATEAGCAIRNIDDLGNAPSAVLVSNPTLSDSIHELLISSNH